MAGEFALEAIEPVEGEVEGQSTPSSGVVKMDDVSLVEPGQSTAGAFNPNDLTIVEPSVLPKTATKQRPAKPQGTYSVADLEAMVTAEPEPASKRTIDDVQAGGVTDLSSVRVTGKGVAPGMLVPGNIDLAAQPKVKNPDGSISTVDSIGLNIDGKEYILPTVTPDGRHFINEVRARGQQLTPQQEGQEVAKLATAEFRKTGRHLGVFADIPSSNAYAKQLHEDYAAGKFEADKKREAFKKATAEFDKQRSSQSPPIVQIAKGIKGIAEAITSPLPVKLEAAGGAPLPVPPGTEPQLSLFAGDGQKPSAVQASPELLNSMSDVMEGVGEAAGPAAVLGLGVAPGATTVTLGLSLLAQKGAAAATEYFGGSPEAQRFVGDLAGLATALGGASQVVQRIARDGIAKVAADARAVRAAGDVEASARHQGFENAKRVGKSTAGRTLGGPPETAGALPPYEPTKPTDIPGQPVGGPPAPAGAVATPPAQSAGPDWAGIARRTSTEALTVEVNQPAKHGDLRKREAFETELTRRQQEIDATIARAASPPPPDAVAPLLPETPAPEHIQSTDPPSPTTETVQPRGTYGAEDLEPVQAAAPSAPVEQQPGLLDFDKGKNRQLDSVDEFGKPLSTGDIGLDVAHGTDMAPAPPPVYFRSGSTRPTDFDGLADARVPIGVTATELSKPVEERLVNYVKDGGQVFLDSGAFGGSVDFDKLMTRYEDLAGRLATASGQLYVVAPDVVGDQAATMALQEKYADRIKALAARGVQVIVPIQQGEVALAYQIRDVLAKFGDVVLGIPFNKSAYSTVEVAGSIAGLGPVKIHLLGIGERNRKYESVIDEIRAANPSVVISSDSNRMAALFGKNGTAQGQMEGKVEERAPERIDNEWASDTTELAGSLWRGDFDVFQKKELEQIASAAGLTLSDLTMLKLANEDSGEDVLGKALDARQDMVFAILHDVAMARARKAERPQARRETITESEQQPKPTKSKKLVKEKSDWTEIGKNAVGQTLYEDQRGVRSYIENGVRQTEPVRMVPTKAGMTFATDRTGDRARTWEVVDKNGKKALQAESEAPTVGEQEPEDVATPDDQPEGRGNRPGQLSERGDGAAEPVRDTRSGPLADVPSEDGEGAGSAGAERPGRGGPESVLADGVPRPAGDVEESQAAPAASGGDVPEPVVVAPSGDTHDPGVAPPDYFLTQARVDAIISRGEVQRARDNLDAIKLIKQILHEKRHATADEQEMLAKYVGWGSSTLAAYFQSYPSHTWSENQKAIWQTIQDMPEEERRAMRRSTTNAHYTYDLYRPIWDAIQAAGFAGGRVLEPAVGTGHAFGFMPPQLREDSTLTASELEPLTAAIAAALYPSAWVQSTGFENIRLPRGTQDLVISNVPFGDFGVSDQAFAGDNKFLTDRIHNYFFAKALEFVRPGGLVVFVSSRYTLDSTDPQAVQVRRYLMERAHFLGAVRMPNTAFDKSAKTEVVADIIVLQRLQEGEKAKNADLFIEPTRLDQFTTSRWGKRGKQVESHVHRSPWYEDHPNLILGTEEMTGSQYGDKEYTVVGLEKGELQRQIREGLAEVLPAGRYVPQSTGVPAPQARIEKGTFKAGEMRVSKDGKRIESVQRDGSIVDATPMKRDGTTVDDKAVARIASMVKLRDALRQTHAAMLKYEGDDGDALIAEHQTRLDHLYRQHTKAYGNLNSQANRRAFRDDPEATNLLGLEIVEPKAKFVTKDGKKTLRVTYEVTGRNDIFEKRTLFPSKTITKVETPKDALFASLATYTRIDWAYMADVSGQSAESLQTSLVGDGMLFKQPDGSFVLADDYLSGDVVTKLEDAEAAGQPFARNVVALKAVQPAAKHADQINVSLGSHWVPAEDVAGFAAQQIGVNKRDIQARIDGSEAFIIWTLHMTDPARIAASRHSLAVTYGAHEDVYTFLDLMSDTLNLKTPTLGHWEKDDDGNRFFVKDENATLAARANQQIMQAEWTTWLYGNDPALNRLVETFNTRFNRVVKRTFDGSHLTYPGMATLTDSRGNVLQFFPHQNNGVWRILTTGNTLLAHEVGAGKTFEMIAAAMEMRRTGRAQKPMITVPTYLLGQWLNDIKRLYPTAKVLAFTEKDLEAKKRQTAMARIAFGDWDIVLVPHSSFGLLKVSDQRIIDFMQKWVDDIMDAESQARSDMGDGDPSVKQMERTRRKLEDRIAARRAALDKGTDNALTWEQLGVDALFVDEAHVFKNLFFFSRLDNLRGLSRSESDRALDLYVKIQDINQQSNYRNLVLATATPVMNSIVEIYTMQRYLQPKALAQFGVDNFDNWYRMFARALPTTEQRPDGSYQEVLRVREYQNLRTLSQMISQVMDYVGWEDMPYLKLPKLKGGKVQIVQTDPHPVYPKIKEWFANRLTTLKEDPPYYNQRTGVYHAPLVPHPITGELGTYDNILHVMTDAAKAAIDLRLVAGQYVTDWEGSRVQAAADHIAAAYKAEMANRGVILAFLDMGTPKDPEPLSFMKGTTIEDDAELVDEEEKAADDYDDQLAGDPSSFNLYDDIRAGLIKRGVKANEIAYIHQARKPAERLALFDAVNKGEVRVLFASTDKGGVGMNVQTLLAEIHEIDPPRAGRPGDIRQRMGRAIRQGNTYPEVRHVRYVTKGTTDEWRWGLMITKDYTVRQFLKGQADSIKDDDPSTMSLEEAQIRSTGDPRGIELTELRGKLARLEAQAAASERTIAKAQGDVARADTTIRFDTLRLKALEQWMAASYRSVKGDKFAMTVGKTTYADRDAANKAVVAAMKGVTDDEPTFTREQPIGEIGGVPIVATAFMREWKGKGGKVQRAAIVHLTLKGEPFEGDDIAVATIEDEGTEFGKGRDVVASLTYSYSRIPSLANEYRAALEVAREKKEASERTLANPPASVAELQRARHRIAALEHELKAEGVADENARIEQRKELAKAAAAKAAKTAEPAQEPHEFASTQVNLTGNLEKVALEMAADIADEDLAEDGPEYTPHVTVKWGLHDDDPTALTELLKDVGPISLTFGPTDYFQNPGQPDVVYISVKSDELTELNARISARLPNTETHPVYTPHVTLGYVKEGLGKKYAGQYEMDDQTFLVKDVTFTARDRTKTVIPLAEQPWRDDEVSTALDTARENWREEGLDNAPTFLQGALDQFQKYPASLTQAPDALLRDLYEAANEIVNGYQENDLNPSTVDRESFTLSDEDRDTNVGLAMVVANKLLREFLRRAGQQALRLEPPSAAAPQQPSRGSGVTLQSTILPGAAEAAEVVAAAGRRVVSDLSNDRSLIIGLLAPARASKTASFAAGDIRAHVAARDQRAARAQRSLAAVEKQMESWSHDESRTFWRVMEGRSPMGALDVERQHIALDFRTILDRWRQALIDAGLLEHYLEYYWPHEWQRASKAGESIVRRLFGKRPIQGPEAYRKPRSIPTMEEGIEGMELEPISWNPATQLLRKVYEMNKSLSGRLLMDDLKAHGTRKYVGATQRPPDDMKHWVKYPDYALGTVYGPRTVSVKREVENDAGETVEETVEGDLTFGRVIAGHYYGPPEVVKLIENHLSPGLWGKSKLFDAYRTVGGFMNSIQLGFSAFHLYMTGIEAVVSKLALSLELASRGEFKHAAVKAAQAPVAPILDLFRGHKMLRNFYEHDADAAVVDDMIGLIIQGGGGFGWSLFDRGGAPEAFMRALRQTKGSAERGEYGSAAASTAVAAWKTLPATVELMMKPIMEGWVPRIKIAAYLDLAYAEVERLGPSADLQTIRRTLDDAWDSIDNRFGELRYDNLFWNNSFKQALMASVRAVGWNVGTLREMFGAFPAQAERIVSNVRKLGLQRPNAGGGAGGRGGAPPRGPQAPGLPGVPPGAELDPWLHHRMAWFISALIVHLLAAGIITYLLTGKTPKDVKDWAFPPNGERDPSGRPRRVAMIDYFKDFYAWKTQPAQTATHKLHPLLQMLWEILVKNEDYYGTEIYDPSDKLGQQIIDSFKYLEQQARPFTWTNADRRGKVVDTVGGKLLNWAEQAVAPVTPAPASVERSDAETLLYTWGLRDRRVKTRTEAETSKVARTIRQGLQEGTDEGRAAAAQAAQLGLLSRTQLKNAVKSGVSGKTFLEVGFKQQTLDRALKLYEVATPEERAKLRPVLMQKAARLLPEAAPATRTALVERFRAARQLPVDRAPVTR